MTVVIYKKQTDTVNLLHENLSSKETLHYLDDYLQ